MPRTGVPALGKTSKTGARSVSVNIAEDVYDAVIQHRSAMESELGRAVTIRDALETLVLAGLDNTEPYINKANSAILPKLREFYQKSLGVPFTNGDVVNMLVAQAWDREYKEEV